MASTSSSSSSRKRKASATRDDNGNDGDDGGVIRMEQESSGVDVVVAFPGDVVAVGARTDARSGGHVSLGAGLLRQADGSVVATKCGVVRRIHRSSSSRGGKERVWVENSQKRYCPVEEDFVVGTVLEKHYDFYRVDVGASRLARLGSLSFEGATKRNRPNIPVGALVYCRVEIANKDMEVELSCKSPHFKAEWVTGESVFGELEGGYAFNTSIGLARKLLEPSCHVLQCLGRRVPFELAIGVNGRVWVNSGNAVLTILITNAILNSEHLPDATVAAMVDQLIDRVTA